MAIKLLRKKISYHFGKKGNSKVRSTEDNTHNFTDMELVRFFFDSAFYLEQYPDIAEAGVDPFEHYMGYGWKEYRDPAPFFSTKAYLLQYKDVTEAGVNPFHHYVCWGRKEERATENSSLLEISRSAPKGLYAEAYNKKVSIASGAKSPDFAPKMKTSVATKEEDPLYIAYYLPQFHPFKENNEWWGKGFTEWTNVSKAVPQFSGHYQPRLPGELGFYDLRVDDVIPEQISLAKQYGVSAFCFHYYWFGGKRLMETPIENFLKDDRAESDFPFCLCWANENWTRRWDGSENDVLIAQNHTREDNEAVFYDLLRYFNDSRYIRVDNKPLVIVYRPEIIPNVEGMVEQWRQLAIENGLEGLHLVTTNAFGFSDPESLGFDALVEFPPHSVVAGQINNKLNVLNSEFTGNVFDYTDVVDYSVDRLNTIQEENKGGNYYPCVMAGWDNEARKPGKGNVFHNASPYEFHRWVKSVDTFSKKNHGKDNKFVFINAWNEWAEGTYLEPDRYYGYAYLSAIASVRSEVQISKGLALICGKTKKNAVRSDKVICLHLYYEDLINEFSEYVANVREYLDVDVVITIPESYSEKSAQMIIDTINPVRLIPLSNRGRDMLPFIESLKEIKGLGYKYGCKIHSKKSPHLKDGRRWRVSIIESLLSKQYSEKAISLLGGSQAGIIAPEQSIYTIDVESPVMIDNLGVCQTLVERMSISPDINSKKFVAGSMYWFKPKAFEGLLAANLNADDFGPELGAVDGTIAHAMERLVGCSVGGAGYEVEGYSVDDYYDPYNSAGAK